MLKTISTQDKEKNYFLKFLDAYNASFDKVCYGDKPDVIVNIKDRKIGIELTDFYIADGKSSEQNQNPMRERIVYKAQELYTKSHEGLDNIEVVLGFNYIDNQRNLPNEIASLIENISEKYGTISIEKFEHIKELKFVHIVQNIEKPKWRLCQVHSIKLSDPNTLQRIIDRKKLKLPDYVTCDKYWLLVVVDFMNYGMDQEINNVDFSNIYHDGFEKVIIYKTTFDDIIEISNG